MRAGKIGKQEGLNGAFLRAAAHCQERLFLGKTGLFGHFLAGRGDSKKP